MMDLMKKAKELQNKMEEVQNSMDELRVTGQAVGGLIEVILNGKHNMQAINIDPSLIKENEKEILEDLILTAHNDAISKLNQEIESKSKAIGEGFPLPKGFKFPF